MSTAVFDPVRYQENTRELADPFKTDSWRSP